MMLIILHIINNIHVKYLMETYIDDCNPENKIEITQSIPVKNCLVYIFFKISARSKNIL